MGIIGRSIQRVDVPTDLCPRMASALLGYDGMIGKFSMDRLDDQIFASLIHLGNQVPDAGFKGDLSFPFLIF
jgi:hypothetical protein